MRHEDACERWRDFNEACPEIAESIYEQALRVCEIGDPETSIESEEFLALRDMVAEHQDELGIPIDISENELLRWATCGVFAKMLSQEQS